MAQPPGRDPLPLPPQHSVLRRVAAALGGSVLLIIGIVLIILPGPGVLLILAGLYVLAQGFPTLEKYVDPVAKRAMKAAEESVATPLRIAGSALAGLAMIGAGVVWGLRFFPWLPLAGWSTGSSLIISGLTVLALLVYSYRHVHARRATTSY